VVENEWPVFVVQVFIEPQSRRRSRQYPFKCGLAHGKRIAPQIVAIELDQIEAPHENIRIMPAVPDAIEGGDTIIPARDRFPVDNAGPGPQPREGLDNQREASSQIIARPAVEPDPVALLAGNNPEPIMLDFVQPYRPERWLRGTGWEARRNKARRQNTRRHGTA
jgi:hypothetical protein